MIELHAVGKRQGWDRLKRAIEEALALGCTDAAAVRHPATADELNRPRSEPFLLVPCNVMTGAREIFRGAPQTRALVAFFKCVSGRVNRFLRERFASSRARAGP
jgi:hypothetical protein